MSKSSAKPDRLPVFVHVEQGSDDGGDILELSPTPVSGMYTEDAVISEEPRLAEPEEDHPTVEEASTTDNIQDSDLVHSAELVSVRYMGNADVFADGQIRFRRGEPVLVPSDIAEKLLINRQERFEAVKE